MPFDQKKFEDTIKICELESDLELFDGKEETEIGERGINLSGGQKQRISIARAVYSEADIFLIDDALSALDAQVANKVLNNVFLGLLKGKTLVISTHYLNILEKVDRVALIIEGRIPVLGPFKEIKNDSRFIDFSQVQNESKKSKNEDQGEDFSQGGLSVAGDEASNKESVSK